MSEFHTLLRFALVGVVATLAYVGVSFLLLATGMMGPAATNIAALTFGIAVSYLGHYYFTYRRPGAHLFFGPRFIIVTAVVFGCSVLLERILNEVVGFSPYHTSLTIALAYPVGSFVLNHFWAFLRGRRAQSLHRPGQKVS